MSTSFNRINDLSFEANNNAIPQAQSSTSTPLTSISTVVIVRHGERADRVLSHPWNQTRLPRYHDPPLTSLGYIQAENLSLKLINEQLVPHPLVIYSSPLTRCVQTSAVLSAKINVSNIQIVYSLSKSCKYLRTCMKKNILAEVPNLAEANSIIHSINPNATLQNVIPDDGLSFQQCLESIILSNQKLHPNHSILIVAHKQSQSALATLSGHSLSHTPHCGRACFQFTNPNNTHPTWTLISTPDKSPPQVPNRTQV